MSDLAVSRGTRIDFVVECRANEAYDSFGWAPVVTVKTATGEVVFSASHDFAGPEAARARPLSRWARYAQVLLETNEFAFVD